MCQQEDLDSPENNQHLNLMPELPNPADENIAYGDYIHELFPDGLLIDELGRAGYRETQVTYDSYQNGASIYNLSMLAPQEALNQAALRQQICQIIAEIPAHHGITWHLSLFVMRADAQNIAGQFAVSPFRVRQ